MKIAIDLRSLQSGRVSGVENYTYHLLDKMLSGDKVNQYVLFYNSFRPSDVEHFHFINSNVVRRRIPNRILNFSLKFFKYPKFEHFLEPFDFLFLPNSNHFAIKPQTKLALTVHDLSPFVFPNFYNLKRRLWHKSLGFKKSLMRADIIFAVSEFTKKDIIEKFGVEEKKIKVVYQGIDHSVYKPNLPESELRRVRNKYSLPGEFILFLATIEPRKNLVGLIEAFNRLPNKVSLVIAGKPGWKFGPSVKKISQSPKREFIHELGYVDEADKPFLLALAKALVFPSFYEGFGFPVLEAMAVGTPVITSNLTSLPEVVGDAGILINPYNINDIANAVETLLGNTVMQKHMREKGLVQAEKFSWEKTASEVLKGLESVNVGSQ